MPLSSLPLRFRRLWTHDIWTAGLTREKNLRSRFLALLRIASITLSGLQELKVAARAAALSYSSLLGLGPLVAIAVLISGFALGDRDPVLAAQGVNEVISFIAPQVVQYQKALANAEAPESPALAGPPAAGAGANAPTDRSPADPQMVKLISNFIANSRSGSGTAGIVGLLALLVIVVLLFTSVEKTFNDIWGVRRGRSFGMTLRCCSTPSIKDLHFGSASKNAWP